MFYLDDMMSMLQSDDRTTPEGYESILGAWINLLRSEVINLAGQDRQFLASLQNGSAVLLLSKFLIPGGWTTESLGHSIAQRTGVSFSTVCATIQRMSKILLELQGEKAFEPVGWFEVASRAEGGGFRVLLWQDFPQPASYRFEEEPLSLNI
jgi:hypothetical protein